MNTVEAILIWAAVATYVTALVAAMVSRIFELERVARFTERFWPAALGLHLAGIIVRWIVTGHGPVMYAYENSLAASLFIGAIFFGLAWRLPAVRGALPVVLFVMLLILGNGLMAPAELSPLEPPFRSGWLVVHVSFAWIAFGSFVVSAVLGGMYLTRIRKAPDEEARKKVQLLDDLCGRLITLGFAGHTVMIASGAIWAHGLWGRYWAWDPVETWSLVTWLIYGINLHFRFTMGWKGKRAAWLAVGSIVALIITFFGIGVISDVHTELL